MLGAPHQGKQLPVATGPAVLAGIVNACMVWMVFDKHHVAHVRAAANAAFEQVMAKHGFVRKALVQHRMQRFDVEQPLARKRAHTKQVLVHIRCAVAVRVNTALACKHGVKGGALVGLRQGCHDPRLQNAVTCGDTLAGRVNLRRVQRMRSNRHQLAQCCRRQAGVAVQGHDVPNAAGQAHAVRHVEGLFADRTLAWKFVRCQHPYQRLQFAALALPTYPLAFGSAPCAPAVND